MVRMTWMTEHWRLLAEIGLVWLAMNVLACWAWSTFMVPLREWEDERIERWHIG